MMFYRFDLCFRIQHIGLLKWKCNKFAYVYGAMLEQHQCILASDSLLYPMSFTFEEIYFASHHG